MLSTLKSGSFGHAPSGEPVFTPYSLARLLGGVGRKSLHSPSKVISHFLFFNQQFTFCYCAHQRTNINIFWFFGPDHHFSQRWHADWIEKTSSRYSTSLSNYFHWFASCYACVMEKFKIGPILIQVTILQFRTILTTLICLTLQWARLQPLRPSLAGSSGVSFISVASIIGFGKQKMDTWSRLGCSSSWRCVRTLEQIPFHFTAAPTLEDSSFDPRYKLQYTSCESEGTKRAMIGRNRRSFLAIPRKSFQCSCGTAFLRNPLPEIWWPVCCSTSVSTRLHPFAPKSGKIVTLLLESGETIKILSWKVHRVQKLHAGLHALGYGYGHMSISQSIPYISTVASKKV